MDNFLPNGKATRVAGDLCTYCGREETPENPLTDDHVVARRFVPKGSLDNCWSVIVRACRQCNNAKSGLEDDISAITLLRASKARKLNRDCLTHAQRKVTNSTSRLTRKAIADSFVKDEVSGEILGSASVSFGFVGPPQIEPERVFKLAAMQLQAFYYLITFNSSIGRGSAIPGEICFVGEVDFADWGNRTIRAFADITRPWSTCLHGYGAQGFFRIIIRGQENDSAIRAFALEWNKSRRIVGFFGAPELMDAQAEGLPKLEREKAGPGLRFRVETPISEEDDILFDFD